MLMVGDYVRINLPYFHVFHDQVGKIIEINTECYPEPVFLVEYINIEDRRHYFTEGCFSKVDINDL